MSVNVALLPTTYEDASVKGTGSTNVRPSVNVTVTKACDDAGLVLELTGAGCIGYIIGFGFDSETETISTCSDTIG